MTDKLKPVRCGCGGEAAVLVGYPNRKGYIYYRVKCWECGTQTLHKRTREEAITAWNRAMGATKEKALRLLIDWAVACGFGYDNIPEEYEKYKNSISDMEYIDGLIYIAEMEIGNVENV